MKQKTLNIWIASLVVILVVFLISGCAKRNPIKIGFAGSITGSSFELGLPAKNGFLLAVDEINTSGGIDGKLIEVVIKDDESSLDTAYEIADAFINEGIELVIGHMTSNMSPAVEYAMNKADILYMSPTMSTALMGDKDDMFLRVVSISDIEGKSHVRVFKEYHNVNKAAVIYDTQNEQFTNPIYSVFLDGFEAQNGEIVYFNKLKEGERDYLTIADDVIKSGAEGLFIITNTIDASSIIQQINKRDYDMVISVTGWSLSNDFLERGGKSIEGVYGTTNHVDGLDTPRYLEFERKYKDRYGTTPSFSSHLAYDAVIVIAEAIERGGSTNIDEVKENIIDIRSYTGLQADFIINEYGDALREHVLIQVEGGEYKRVKIEER